MKDNYIKFLKETNSLGREAGSAAYSFEFFNQNVFPFSGFDEFNRTYESKIKNILNFRESLETFKPNLENTLENFNNTFHTKLLSMMKKQELIQKSKTLLNSVIFKSSTDLIFKQWIKLIDKYNLSEHYKEDFKKKQNEAVVLLNEINLNLNSFNNIISDLLSYPDKNFDYFNYFIKNIYNEETQQTIKYIENLSEHVEKLNNINKSIFKITTDIIQFSFKDKKRKINIFNDMADDFIEFNLKNKEIENQNNNIVKLLNDKNNDSIVNKIILTKSQKYEEVNVFINGQIVFKDNKGNYIEPKSKSEAFIMINDFYESMIAYELRKNPSLSKLIIDKFKDEDIRNNINSCLELVDLIQENSNILKNTKFKLNTDNSIESISDSIHFIVKNFKVNQLANSILSNKYKHLISDENIPIFEKMFDSNFTKTQLQNFIGKKLASCKTPKEFSEHLKSVYNSIFTFGKEKLNADLLIASNPVHIVQEENLNIIKIDNFNDSKLLGTSNWCISRSENTFLSYQAGNHQYFIYDFSKDETDNKSLIGITLYSDGTLNAAHDKVDDNLIKNSYINELLNKIIVSDFENLTNLHKNPEYPKFLKLWEEKNKNNQKKPKNLTMELK